MRARHPRAEYPAPSTSNASGGRFARAPRAALMAALGAAGLCTGGLGLGLTVAGCEDLRPDPIPPSTAVAPEPEHEAESAAAGHAGGSPDRDVLDPLLAVGVPRPGHRASSGTSAGKASGTATPSRGEVTPPADALVLQSASDVVVRHAPEAQAPLIGIIARTRSFVAWDLEEGPGCKGQWARLEHGGYACLRSVSESRKPLATLPAIRPGELVPFHYVAARDTSRPIPVWRSAEAFASKEAPHTEYAGNSRLALQAWKSRASGEQALLVERGRTFAKELMRVLEPSQFEGRDLLAAPPPTDGELGWMLETVPLRDRPDEEARSLGMARKHVQITVMPPTPEQDPRTSRSWRFVQGQDAKGHAFTGWVEAKHLRVWTPPPALDDVAPDEVWIDVDSTHQTLTLMRGASPVFATLVSTGKAGDRTPPGIYRIRMKHAWGTMRNLPGAEEPYHVEGVPWAQYFHKRYALHGVYWHNGFGRPASHGCVNLSPKDARRVFEATSPNIPAGWRSVHETTSHPGTVVRVRRGDAPTPDRRKELERVDDETSLDDE